MAANNNDDKPVVRVCALYPDLMNIYADRGNLFVLQRRCAWRGIGFELVGSGLGDPLDGEAHDIYYLGGGQDRDQLLCAEDLVAGKRDALQKAASRGAVVLGVCGGYQLLGSSYALGEQTLEGVGLLDVRTVREPGERLIGNVAIEVTLPSTPLAAHAEGHTLKGAGKQAGDLDGGLRVLAGFENHGGRTYLGESATPLGWVLKGHGNDGRSGFEGAREGNVIGTYLHGPLLPKNAWFADWLIAAALGIGVGALARLDDAFENEAHSSARRAAGV
jgi:CobQ-like glutamine amidotransferase family enzyme